MGDVPACAGARGAASGPGVGMDGAGWGTGVRGVALGVTGAMGGQWQGGEHVAPSLSQGWGKGLRWWGWELGEPVLSHAAEPVSRTAASGSLPPACNGDDVTAPSLLPAARSGSSPAPGGPGY